MFSEKVLLAGGPPERLAAIGRALASAGVALDTVDGVESIPAQCETGPYAVGVFLAEENTEQAAKALSYFEAASPSTACIALVPRGEDFDLTGLFDFNSLYDVCDVPSKDASQLARAIGRAIERRHLLRHNAYLLTELREAREAIHSHETRTAHLELAAVSGCLAEDFARALVPPMRAIAAYTSYLSERLASQRTEEADSNLVATRLYLNHIRESAERCQRLAEWLQPAVSTTTELQVTDLGGLLVETFALLRDSLDSRGIELDADVAAECCWAFASRAALQQAVAHVAMRATAEMPGGGSLHVELENGKDARDTVAIRLCPRAEDRRAKVVAHANRTSQFASEVSLSALRYLMRLQNGDACIEQEPRGGTAVVLSLKRAKNRAHPPEIALVRAA